MISTLGSLKLLNADDNSSVVNNFFCEMKDITSKILQFNMKKNTEVVNLSQKMKFSGKIQLLEIDPTLTSEELSVIQLSIQKAKPKFIFLRRFYVPGHHILLHLKLTRSNVTSV